MKYAYRVALITVAVCLVISALASTSLGGGFFLPILGAVFLFASVITGFVGIVSNAPGNRKAYLLTAGIVLLLGMGICGPVLFIGIG
jgi:hypothetical protein